MRPAIGQFVRYPAATQITQMRAHAQRQRQLVRRRRVPKALFENYENVKFDIFSSEN